MLDSSRNLVNSAEHLDFIKDRLTFRLRLAYHQLCAFIESESMYDITITQMFILSALFSRGSLDQTQISKELLFDKMTISVAIRNLVRKGLVLKKKSKKDKRRNLISLTKKADKNILKLVRKADAQYQIVQSALTPKEYVQLLDCLEKVARVTSTEESNIKYN